MKGTTNRDKNMDCGHGGMNRVRKSMKGNIK
jgi:hypothetical protein